MRLAIAAKTLGRAGPTFFLFANSHGVPILPIGAFGVLFCEASGFITYNFHGYDDAIIILLLPDAPVNSMQIAVKLVLYR